MVYYSNIIAEKCCLYFFTLQHRVWTCIVIVHEKCVFSFVFFRNISKTAERILLKKIERNHSILVYKKSLVIEHQKITFLRDINYLCLLFSKLSKAQKLV